MATKPPRRRVAINIAHGPASPHCNECDARHVGMCDALSDEDLAFLSCHAQRVSVQPNALFIEEAEPAAYFYNINAGTVRVFRSLPDGRRHVSGFMGVGQFLGLDIAGAYAFSAQAIGDVQLCRFHRQSLTEIFSGLPALERRLLTMTLHELTAAHDQMLLLGRKTAQERLASFLIAWAARTDDGPADGLPEAGATLPLPMSRGDLADYLGLTIETVSRTLNQFKREGLVGLEQLHEIRLLQPERLSGIAHALT